MKAGYFSIAKLENKYIGGILIIDDTGIPLDFKYTEPVIPSPLQEAIYGKSLDSHIKQKLIAKELFKELNGKLQICFTDIENINIAGQFVKFAVGLAETMLSADLKPGEYKQIKQNEYIISTKEHKSPVRLLFQDLPPSKILNGLEIAQKIATNLNITEPFLRIENAFNIICSK
jgi:hypothetical protein